MRSIKDFQPKKVSDSKKSKINTKDTLRLTAIQKARTGFVYVLLILWTCIILLPVIGVLISSLNVKDSNYISFDFKNFKFGFDNLKEKSNMPNDLEFALLEKYSELKYLHSLGFQMSGSGPTYFVKKEKIDANLDKNYLVIENLKTINYWFSSTE